jgi:hypothetical protein
MLDIGKEHLALWNVLQIFMVNAKSKQIQITSAIWKTALIVLTTVWNKHNLPKHVSEDEARMIKHRVGG